MTYLESRGRVPGLGFPSRKIVELTINEAYLNGLSSVRNRALDMTISFGIRLYRARSVVNLNHLTVKLVCLIDYINEINCNLEFMFH